MMCLYVCLGIRDKWQRDIKVICWGGYVIVPKVPCHQGSMSPRFIFPEYRYIPEVRCAQVSILLGFDVPEAQCSLVWVVPGLNTEADLK